jgi:glycerol-3-phosphate dehydrogenase (NAD(P)+)
MRIALLGAGAWGTALAIAFAARHAVTLWARDPVRVAEMSSRRENTRYLPDCPFPPALQVTADFSAALAAADLAILAAPLAGLRPMLEQLKATAPAMPFLWVCKGLEAGSGLLPHQVVDAVMGDAACGVLTGPSFALEVARGLPAAVTLAATDAAFAAKTAQSLHGGKLRIYATEDLVGAEVGGAVKNVLAIATGICDGLGLGNNARAALITRGLVEITRFGEALGARRETFMGLAGMGDLMLTCTGDLSRNRRVGLLLAAGKALPDIVRELGHVAEGVPAAREVARRAAELGIDMPITRAVTAVLDGRITPVAAVEQLMARDPKHE